jgi:tetratricopeptide (TPR) repeat protein
MSVKTIKLETPARRIILLVVLLFCLAGTFFVAKWCIANAIASQAIYKEVAELAIDWAPDDPQTHYSLAVLNEKTFLIDDLSRSLEEYEKAAALAPNDFRLWLAVGKAREHTGDAAGAEKALRKALELAPNYAEVRWIFGNILLREGKMDEAFAEIRSAVVSDSKYTNQAIATASEMFDGELVEIKRNLGDSMQIQFALAAYLGRRKRFDEALQIWITLPENEKKTTFKQIGEDLYQEMIAAKKYRSALRIQQEISESETDRSVGKISNGGFEDEIKTANQGVFDWQIAEGARPQIGPNNAQKRSGNLSLLIIFNSSDGKDFRAVSQIIAVEPGRRYEFETFYKSELKTSAGLKWEIADAADGKILAATGATSAGADWAVLRTEFVVPEGAEGVVVRLARESCKTLICPISGSIWFDDFSIK